MNIDDVSHAIKDLQFVDVMRIKVDLFTKINVIILIKIFYLINMGI